MLTRYARWILVATIATAIHLVQAGVQAQTCSTDDQCNDGVACTVDACKHPDGVCQHTKVDALCAPGTGCRVLLGCGAAGCIYSKDDSLCNDGFLCTTDACNPDDPNADPNGCIFSRDDSKCDDLIACTDNGCDPTNPAHNADGCVYSKNDANCEDNNLCTTNGCDPTSPNADSNGCVFESTCGACCTGNATGANQTAGDNGCIVTSRIECEDAFEGSYQGDGTDCPNSACAAEVTGACCTSGPTKGGPSFCDDEVPQSQCLDGSFTSFFPNEFCSDIECGLALGACCHAPNGVATADAICDIMPDFDCAEIGGTFFGEGTDCTETLCSADRRLSTVKKGSLLIFPSVELRWTQPTVAGGTPSVLTQDTILTLVNDFNRNVHVKLYFVNGDPPTAPIYADDLQNFLVEREHNGWNNVDCVLQLSENESTYLKLSTGETDPHSNQGGSCQRFTILDPGDPPGRPSLDPSGERVMRGFVIAFAVDENQQEISWNHLSGQADIVQYGLRSAWEYQAYAFAAVNPVVGAPTDGTPGELNLNGVEYDYSFNSLLFDFFASGSMALSSAATQVMLDTQLTLLPVSADLRQDSCGPITTKAHFDIWNANEDFRSGTARCITCWDQTLLSAYSIDNGLDNNFILEDLGTDKGKARIDGMQSFECDNRFVPPNLDDAILQWLLLHDHPQCDPGCANTAAGCVAGGGVPVQRCCNYTINDSQAASLLGVAAKILHMTGNGTGTTWAGSNLVGAGQESAQILFDVPAPPEPARSPNSDPNKQDTLRNSDESKLRK